MALSISEEEGWDRAFLDLSSKAAEPLCWAYGLLRYRMVAPLDPKKFNHCESKIAEIAFRCFIATATFAAPIIAPIAIFFTAVALGVTSKILRGIGFAFQRNHYTHIQGTAPEKRLNGEAKILTWNICGIGGGMHYDHGGVIDWRSRVDGIVEKILKEDPDVLTLQEIYDTALAEALIKKLGPHYAHFFTHLGANVMGSVSGVMVISKCAVHRFTNTSFENNKWTLNRAFATLEIKAKPEDTLPCARIIGTHLIHDDNAKRMAQVAQIVNSVAKERFSLPTVLAGDFNLQRDKPDEGKILDPYLIHSYRGEEPTCTGELLRRWDPNAKVSNEIIDYISLFRRHLPDGRTLPVVQEGVEMVDTHLVRAFDATFNTKTALTDHHGVATTLRWFLS